MADSGDAAQAIRHLYAITNICDEALTSFLTMRDRKCGVIARSLPSVRRPNGLYGRWPPWRTARFPYSAQILQITPVPGIWTSGPLPSPTKCVSEPLSRTAP
jgi:hypothetical protein